MTYRTHCTRLGIALAAAAMLATPVFGQNQLCIQDAYNYPSGTKSLSCTANDVSIANVVPGTVTVFSGGVTGSPDECLSGGTFSFTAEFNIKTTSSSARSNIGIFFAGGSQTQAKTGQCSDSILAPVHSCAVVNGVPTGSCGSNQYEELDTSINGETAANYGCGDTASSDGSGTGIQQSVLEVDGVTCPTTAVPCPTGIGLNNQTCMALNYCTGWYQPAKGMPVCSSPTWSWVQTAIPGTSSKCDCSVVYVPIQPVQPAISVAKNCNIGSDTTAGLTTCHAGAEGNTVKYTVTITNTTPSGEGGVNIDQICDNQYGTIYRWSSAPSTLAACSAGAITSVTPTFGGCSTYDVKSTAAVCTFTVTHGENLSVVDKATVYAQSDLAANTPATPTDSNTVTVDSTDAPTTVSTSLSLGSPQYACVTLPFTVTVQNTSSADENVTLSTVGTYGATGYVPALLDTITFGDVTHTHGDSATSGSVTSTTCAPAPGGGGSFSTILSSGTGTPPTTDGGKYTCTFNGVICGVPTGTAVTNCAAGLSAQSKITPNLTGDDAAPNADSITVSASTFTANVCLVQSGS